jgi:hypothetical protein
MKNLSYEIIESTERVGGRIKTVNYDNVFDWQYSDLGAMRLPSNNTPVIDLVDYINEKIHEKNVKEH